MFASGGGLDNPIGLTFGPDGHLYVGSGDTNQVLRYDGATGAFLGVFASSPLLNGVRHVNFGPDGDLYVANGGGDNIVAFDGVSGAVRGVFASAPGLNGPTSFTFGPDGNLYVVSVLTNQVFRFDGASGAFLDVFIDVGLNGPHDVGFGPDGAFYVVNAFGLQKVRRYDLGGALIDTFVNDFNLQNPLGLTWDSAGDLLVANQGKDEVRRYDGKTGALKDVLIATGSGGLDGSMFVVLRPPSGLVQHPPSPSGVGVDVVFAADGAQPGGLVGTLVGTTPGSIPFCPGLVLGIANPTVLGVAVADESGGVRFGLFVPPTVSGLGVLLQTLDATGCRASDVVAHTF